MRIPTPGLEKSDAKTEVGRITPVSGSLVSGPRGPDTVRFSEGHPTTTESSISSGPLPLWRTGAVQTGVTDKHAYTNITFMIPA
jgi:hypothetical protein